MSDIEIPTQPVFAASGPRLLSGRQTRELMVPAQVNLPWLPCPAMALHSDPQPSQSSPVAAPPPSTPPPPPLAFAGWEHSSYHFMEHLPSVWRLLSASLLGPLCPLCWAGRVQSGHGVQEPWTESGGFRLESHQSVSPGQVPPSLWPSFLICRVGSDESLDRNG